MKEIECTLLLDSAPEERTGAATGAGAADLFGEAILVSVVEEGMVWLTIAFFTGAGSAPPNRRDPMLQNR